MGNKIIISEEDLTKIIKRVLSEQTGIINPTSTEPPQYLIYKKWVEFSDVIRPKIEKMGKELYPANEMLKKDKQFRIDPSYRIIKDREDAYCHQLASAMASSMFGDKIGSLIGKANEWYGGLRIFFKGNPLKNIPKYTTFDSGYSEDDGNNELGIQIAKKYPNKSLEFYSNEVIKNIKNNNYYDNTGKKHQNISNKPNYQNVA